MWSCDSSILSTECEYYKEYFRGTEMSMRRGSGGILIRQNCYFMRAVCCGHRTGELPFSLTLNTKLNPWVHVSACVCACVRASSVPASFFLSSTKIKHRRRNGSYSCKKAVLHAGVRMLVFLSFIHWRLYIVC
jgi:hypothetical protein